LLPVRRSALSMYIAQNLANLLGTQLVQRFDARLGETVMIDPLWTIRSAAGTLAPACASMRETIESNGYDGLISAHSRALAALRQQIAETIRSGKTTGP